MTDLINDPKTHSALTVILMAIAGWFGRREIKKLDETLCEHADKIAELEKDRVTRDDFDELRSSLTATFVHGVERLESSVETRHKENREDLAEIRKSLTELVQRP